MLSNNYTLKNYWHGQVLKLNLNGNQKVFMHLVLGLNVLSTFLLFVQWTIVVTINMLIIKKSIKIKLIIVLLLLLKIIIAIITIKLKLEIII